MKFCLDARTATDHFPGIGRYVSNLARGMVEQLTQGEELIVIRDPTRPSRWELPTAQPGRVTISGHSASPFGVSQQWEIPKLLKSNKVGIYHSPYYLMPYGLRTPTLVTIYDLIPQFYSQYVSARARWLFQLTTWLALRAADRVICISEATRKDLLAAYRLNPDRVSAIPLAPDPIFRPQPEGEVRRLRAKYGLPEQFVLYLGINKPHKNLVRLVEAWAQVQTDAPRVIAGVWDERYPQVKDLVAEMGLRERVLFFGPVSNADQPVLYAAAIVFVFPSLYEGFGLPVVEAMACGTPVACSNTSSLPEAAGDAAFFFNPADVESITRALNHLLDDSHLRQKLSSDGMEQAARFTWEKTAKRTLEQYRAFSHKT
jgi:alpha-1,3-rhamnosyl/mannosyltransferase